MTNKKIAILGAGWLGKPLALKLQHTGHEVRVAASSSASCQTLQKKFEQVFQIHIDASAVSASITDFLQDIDIVIITIPPDRKTDSKNAQLSSLIPYLKEAAISKVVYTSSIGVYPLLNTTVTEETAIQNTNHPCFENEQLLLDQTNFETTILRLAGLIGGERHPGNFFRKKGKITNCESPVNLVHQVDGIGAIEKILYSDGWNAIYNVCAETHPSKADFYTKAMLNLGIAPPICEKAEHPSFKVVSSSKLKTLLNFEYIYSDLMQLLESNKWK